MSDAEQKASKSSPTPVPPEMRDAPDIVVRGRNVGELTSTPTPPLDAAHGGFAEFHEDYVRHYISFADTKAAWTFTIAAGVIAYVFGSDKFEGVVAGPVCSPQFLLLATTMILLVASAICSFFVIAPRLKSASGEGIVYFGAVASRKSADEYVRDVASRSENELTEARLKHCYDISGICTKKYKYLKGAIWCGLPALVGMALVLLLT